VSARRRSPLGARRTLSLAVVLSVAVSALVAVAAGPASAATVWSVDGADPACSDAGAGTPAAPFCTIQAGAKKAQPGDTVQVDPAVYREQVTPPASGSPGSPITFVATGPGAVVVGTADLSGATWSQVGATGCWSTPFVPASNPTQVFLAGGRLAPAADAASCGATSGSFFFDAVAKVLYVNAGGGSPSGMAVEAGARTYGFDLVGLHDVVVDGFGVRSQNQSGVRIAAGATAPSSAITVQDLAVSLTGSYGIQVDSTPGPVTVAANDVTASASNGIRLVGSTGVTVQGNTSHQNLFNGIALQGSSGNLIAGNTVYGNAKPGVRAAVGIDVNGASNDNVVTANTMHDNQDSGMQVYNGSNDNVITRNVSYANGDHGFDAVNATGNSFVSDTAYGNAKDGFSVEGGATSTTIRDDVAVDNGLTTDEFDLYVASDSVPGTTLDYDLAWNSSAGTAVKFDGVRYPTLGAFRSSTGLEAHGVDADPGFADPASGDLHLSAGSPAVDAADSGVAGFSAPDRDGRDPVDIASVPNTGAGPTPYADIGAYELPSGEATGPTAALSVSPASGPAPLQVTADASASTPGSSPIQSYTFDFGDGSTVGPQAGAVATHTYAAAGTFTVKVTVLDQGSLSSTATGQVTVTGSGSASASSPRILRDASAGGAEKAASDPLAFADGRTMATGAFATSSSPTRYLEFVMNAPLASGAAVSGAKVRLTFASAGGTGSGNACMYFEVRRASSGALLGTHGSASAPAACSAGAALKATATSVPEVSTSAVADDLKIRVYGWETGGKAWKVDLATVTGSVPNLSFTLYRRTLVDRSTGTATTKPWSLEAAGDGSTYRAASAWGAAFAPTRYLKLQFPAYAPSGATVAGAVLAHAYRSAGAGTTCVYLEVYTGTTLIGTHGSAASPLSCAGSSTVTDTVPLPEVDTVAEANALVVKVFVRSSASGRSLHDRATLTVSFA
jgi:parallel beta-helix repeat protein